MSNRALAESIQRAQLSPEVSERLEHLARLESGPINMRPVIEVEECPAPMTWVDRILGRKPKPGKRTRTLGH